MSNDKTSCPIVPTPRTDTLLVQLGAAGSSSRFAEHARQLERELAEANAKMAQMLAAAVADIALDENRLGESALRSQDEVIERAVAECDGLAAHYDGLVESAERSGPSAKGYVRDSTWYDWIGAAGAYRRSAAIIRRALKASSEKAHD